MLVSCLSGFQLGARSHEGKLQGDGSSPEIRWFFMDHICNGICKTLGLEPMDYEHEVLCRSSLYERHRYDAKPDQSWVESKTELLT